RPGAEPGAPWDVEVVDEASAPYRVQLGVAPDGRRVHRDLPEGGTVGEQVFVWDPAPDGWRRTPVEVDPTTVEWEIGTRQDANAPTPKPLEGRGGNVFHKCLWFDPQHGEPGILTISGNLPYLKLWRRAGAEWRSEVLWTAEVGLDEHRLRDVEVGDVDGDGVDELVIATHNLGRVYVLEQTPQGFVATAISSTDYPYFVHEIELADVDGDGLPEIFATPSEPNRTDGGHQKGEIVRFDFEGGSYVQRVVDAPETRHAKEILATDFFGDGRPVVFAALEGEGATAALGGGAAEGGSGTLIRMYRFDGAASAAEDVLPLPGEMCRFLNVGDTNGDGVRELIASTKADGVHALWREGDAWRSRVLVPSYLSSGFEHATLVTDLDADGRDDLVLASDDQKRLQWVRWDPERDRYPYEILHDFGDAIYFTWFVGVLPPGE
ncbi:MAG TPA: FG-GAP-like repeat-containing protein, partial [Planctomycetota bacterium]|nr:FG-GAP-like repeat-containing protein [Planctomycetota bacterium]